MRPTTYPSKETTPPLQILFCPAGEGHYWVALNPSWFSDSRPYRDANHWCPDHEMEKRAYVSEQRAKGGRKTPRVYMNGQPPPTRMCTSPDPKTHKPRAVLPSHKFYRKKHTRKDGSTYVSLDPRCKECRRRERSEYKARMQKENPKEWERRERTRLRKNSARRRAGRRARAKEKDVRLDIGPFRGWLKRYIDTTGFSIAEVARTCGVNKETLRNCTHKDQRYVPLTFVDKVGTGTDNPTLLRDLYGK